MQIYGATYGSASRCSHTPEEVVEIDGVTYFAADENHVMEFDGDLVVNLTKMPNTYRASEFEELYDDFDISFKEIMVPWPDFGIPLVKHTFWQALHKVIKKKKYTRVCIQCGHSHGRTGTALSAMLIVNCGMKAVDAIDLVRDAHCEDAVESTEQCSYLLDLDQFFNDREITESDYPVPSIYLKMAGAKDSTDTSGR